MSAEKDKTIVAGTRAHGKQQQILQSAFQEFAMHGYSAASMDRICERAGVSKATVYSYFRDKENLYGELIDQKLQEACFLDLKKLPKGGSMNTYEHIAQLADVLGCQSEDPETETLINFMRMTIAESGRFPEMSRMFVERVEKPINEALIQYLKDCGVKKEDAAPMSWIVSGTFIYHIIINRVLSSSDIMPMELSSLSKMLGKLIECYIEKYK